MEGRFFTPARYEALLAKETTAGLIESLRESPYAEMLERTAERGVIAQHPTSTFVDEALRRDLCRSLSRLRHFATDRPRELMDALLLHWDAYNLKTIIRGKRAQIPTQEILASTFPVGLLDETALVELIRVPSLRALTDTVETWRLPISRPLRDGLRALGESDDLQPLEFELDRWTFAEAFRTIANGDDNDCVMREYLRLRADKVNLLTAFRFLEERSALSPIEATRHFLDVDGRFTRAQYAAVVGARDLRHGLSLLAGTPFGWLASSVAEGAPVSLPRLERRLERGLLEKAGGLMRCDPLGIGVAIAYVERKVNEIRNIRMILRGKISGMGNELISEWLIIRQ